MNAKRRKQISKIYDLIDETLSQLQGLRDEENEAYDNMPESLQFSEKGEKMKEYVDEMDNAISSLQESRDFLSEVVYD